MRRLACLLLCLTLGCRDSAYMAASRQDTPEAWRRFLRTHPDDPDVGAAQERLAELEFEAARKVHTPLSYKRYLEEFPEGAKAPAARALLESLRYNAAKERGGARAWRAFLREHPDGAHRAEAERRLAEAEIQELSASDDAQHLAQLARSHPEDPRGVEAATRVDDQSFAAARSAGAARLLDYLRDFPAGAHRQQAQARLLRLELEGLLASGLVDEAVARAARSPLTAQLGDWNARLAQGRADLAAAQSRDPAVVPCLPAHYVRTLEDLERSLAAPDSLDRWQAAEELGQVVSVRAIDPLVHAIRGARSALVRARAFDSLGSVLRALPYEAAEYEVATRLADLRSKQADSDVDLSVAVLLDLSGQKDAAAIAYQRTFEVAAPDPLVLWRWASLRRERGQAFSAAVAARQLALWTERVAQAEDVRQTHSALASARALCGAVEFGRFAVETIGWARSQKTEFPEDLVEFDDRAKKALGLAQARLKDAEVRLLEQDAHARLCADRQVQERLAEGRTLRMAALGLLPRRASAKVASATLQFAQRFDPSAEVRAEAARLLAQPKKR